MLADIPVIIAAADNSGVINYVDYVFILLLSNLVLMIYSSFFC